MYYNKDIMIECPDIFIILYNSDKNIICSYRITYKEYREKTFHFN